MNRGLNSQLALLSMNFFGNKTLNLLNTKFIECQIRWMQIIGEFLHQFLSELWIYNENSKEENGS